MKRRKRSRQGVTLIEVMVVMVILAMISAAAGFAVLKNFEQARLQETKTRARTIQSAVVQYLTEHSECPDTTELVKSGILERSTDPNDGWGRPYTIECDEATIHVASTGHDGLAGTPDDVAL